MGAGTEAFQWQYLSGAAGILVSPAAFHVLLRQRVHVGGDLA
jgi:hypothetical protein